MHRRKCSGVESQHFRSVALAAHDDGAAVVDVLRDHVEDALHRTAEHTRARHTASLFDDHGHGQALVEQAQLSFRGLLVRRVQKDASVEDRPVHIRDHGTDIASGVRLALRGVLEELHRLMD